MLIINTFIKKQTLFTALLLLLSTSLFAHFGPRSPLGGTVSCAIEHNGFVYVGTEEGGVFESTTALLTVWRPRPVGLLSGKISALAHSGSYLFTGTADSGMYIFDGFVGTDRYWRRINNGITNLQIKALVALDTISVLAGTNGGGLFKTIDKGATWNLINDPLLNGVVITSMMKSATRVFLTTIDGGVFASDDNGDTWFDFNDSNTFQVNGTNKLSYNLANDELLVLNDNGLFVATSASVTTTPVYTSAQSNLASGTDVRALSNNGTDWYLATDNGIYVSPVISVNWSSANTGLTSLDATAIVTVQDTVVSAVRRIGIYKSATATISWTLSNTGFNNILTHSMAMSGDSLVVAVMDDGVYVSHVLGTAASYVKSNNGLTDSTNVNDVVIINNQTFAAATTNGGIFLTTNQGASWSTINTGLTNMHFVKFFYANNKLYVIEANDDFFVADIGIYTWSPLQDGLSSNVVPTSMAFYGNDIFLGTMGDGVYTKSHSETAWTPFNSGLTNTNVTSVAAASGKVFAGTYGNSVFVSDITTDAWTQTAPTSIPHTLMMGLDSMHIQAMASYAGYVYASCKGCLHASSDNGATWEEAGNQFNLPSYTNVNKIGFITTRVFVTTDNNGPYANSLAELPVLPNFLTLSDYILDVPETANTNIITVTSNVSWTLTSDQPWLTVSQSSGFRDGHFNVTAADNPGAPRTGTITATSDSLAQPVTLVVNQEGFVGIADNFINVNANIFPNPNDGTFIVNFSNEVTCNRISLFDVTGKLLYQTHPDMQTVGVPVNVELSAGVYTLSVDTDKGTFYRKLMIH